MERPRPSAMPNSRMTALPSTGELQTLGATVRLRDGAELRLRQGEPGDRELLLRGFERLSEESRYRRFLAPMPELSASMVDYLTDVDHHDHEAIVAIDPGTGDGVGVARYVRDPQVPDQAEVAVTVIDDWQGRGVGTLLLEVICGRAREEGIRTFTAVLLATNQEMMDVFRALGPVRIVDHETGTVEIEMPIPTIGVPAALKKLVQVSACREIIVPIDNRHVSDRAVSRRGHHARPR